MKKFIGAFLVFSILAFSTPPVNINQEPILSTTPIENPSQTQNQTQNTSPCPTKSDLKSFLISRNLATYTIVDIVPSKAVPGYCDIILQSPNNKMFFMRIRNDMAYIISGSVINAATNEVQTPDLKKYSQEQTQNQSTTNPSP